MALVDDAFNTYLRRITPPRTQFHAAKRSHHALRTFLEKDDYFGPMVLETFLNGSYARGTAIRPIKDVDVIVVVGRDWRMVPPDKAMESLRRKLAVRYPERRTLRQRRAVRVTLSDMQLDVLLAHDADAGGGLMIPDRRKQRWISTNPKLQLELATALKRATNSNYASLVKLLKAWFASKVAAPDRPASFVLECGAYHILSASPREYAGALPVAFARLLQELVRWNWGMTGWFGSWTPDVRDPALRDVNVASRWKFGAADRATSRLKLAVEQIERAGRSRWEESEVDHWQTVFGLSFPAGQSLA